ncbi:MAG: ATP-binding cassette domain-containing protein [Eubacteriales bacterium]|nr:ATP-binding cassette domain-containing protein [Eubacteriales bacterium]
MSRSQKILGLALALLAWLALWHFLAQAGFFAFLLPGPLASLSRLWQILGQSAYLTAAWQSCLRVVSGFLLGLLLALLAVFLPASLGQTGTLHFFLRYFVDIPIKVLRSLPLATLVVLLLFILNPRQIALCVALVLSLQGYYPLLKSSLQEHQSLREAAQVYQVSPCRLWGIFHLGSLFSLLAVSAESTLGLAFKASLAAELLAFTPASLGLILHEAKLNLDMELLFAVTLLVIFLALSLTKLFGLLCQLGAWFCLRKFPLPGSSPSPGRQKAELERGTSYVPSFSQVWTQRQKVTAGPALSHPQTVQDSPPNQETILQVEDLSFSYGGQPLFSQLNFTLARGQILWLNSPSGSGKSTLAYLLAGLLQPSQGQIHRQGRLAMAFQEPRLFPDMDAVDNVLVFAGHPWRATDRQKARQLLLELQLPEDQLACPLSTYSVGMKQRVALATALFAQADLLILDEPFANLDCYNREKASQILPTQTSAILLISHQTLTELGIKADLLPLNR